MRIAIGSDGATELTTALMVELEKRGHQVIPFIPVAREILDAWFSTPTDTGGAQGEWTLRQISCIRQLEAKYGGQTR